MTNELIYIRVLEQDTCDQIRIGARFPAFSDKIGEVVENTKKQYGEKCAWCGGYEKGCERYYRRIAIVDADTLQSIREIWSKPDNNVKTTD